MIQAIQWTGENTKEVLDFIGRQITVGQVNMFTGKVVDMDIPTLEGTMKATVGDWIIKGVKGEFYPCKPDIFEQTYELQETSGTPECYSIVAGCNKQDGYCRISDTFYASSLKDAICKFLDKYPDTVTILEAMCIAPCAGG